PAGTSGTGAAFSVGLIDTSAAVVPARDPARDVAADGRIGIGLGDQAVVPAGNRAGVVERGDVRTGQAELRDRSGRADHAKQTDVIEQEPVDHEAGDDVLLSVERAGEAR